MKVSLPKNIKAVMEILYKSGFNPYLVGGCVRDSVMGISPHDYDITVKGFPNDIIHCFESLGYKTIPKGREFGTVGILSDGEVVEVTPYRTEGSYSDSRHPDSVEFVSDIRLDLSRRDFTINAMAMDINGEILDLFDGKSDLEKGVIRCVGNASERFSEDALRILRAIRFASRFGFEIDSSTLEAMHKCAPGLHNVSGERIYCELLETLLSKNSYKVLYDCCEVIQHILPYFKPDKRLSENYGDFAYRLYLCIADGGLDAVEDVHSLLKLSNFDFERLCELNKINTILCKDTSQKIVFDDKIKRLLCNASESAVRDIFIMTNSDTSELDKFISNGTYRPQALAIKGGDIVKIGKFPIKDTSIILHKILQSVAVGELSNDREVLLKYLYGCKSNFYME